MKQIMVILFVILIGIMACKDKKKVVDKGINEQQTTMVVQDSAKDSAEIRTVITDFYNWYNKNYTKFEKYHLYSGIKKKDAPPYIINWDEVEKYQQYLRESVPQLGEEFIGEQKHFLQQCDSAFKVDVEDDIPFGFDYDWYTNSQEDPQYVVDKINRAYNWIIQVNGDHATVDVKGIFHVEEREVEETIIKLEMKKEAGKWKIARIGLDNYFL